MIGGPAAPVFEAGSRLRANGWRVRLSPGAAVDALIVAGERVGARRVLVAREDGSVVEVRQGSSPMVVDLAAPPVREDVRGGVSR